MTWRERQCDTAAALDWLTECGFVESRPERGERPRTHGTPARPGPAIGPWCVLVALVASWRCIVEADPETRNRGARLRCRGGGVEHGR